MRITPCLRRSWMTAVVLTMGLLIQAGGAVAQNAPADHPAQKLRDPSKVLVIAHRGCVGEAPEVSVVSIHACAGKGIDGIELDIRKSKDGVLVAIHDATLDRTTSGTGRVADFTVEELRRLRLRRGNGGPDVIVTEEHLPTLEEMLLAARQHGFIVHLDIKDATHAEVAAAIAELGMEGQATAWLNGAPDAAHQPDSEVGQVLAIVPRIQDCHQGAPRTCEPNDLDDLMGFARYNPAGYFLSFRSTPEFFSRVNAAERPAGTRLFTETLWGIDSLPAAERHAQYRRLLEAGATMFLTDKPEDMVAFMRGEEDERAVLLISVDGLHPSYVFDADRLGLQIPTLRKLMMEGAYAAGVTGVTPTVTYPNHTSIITGVAPAEHGVGTNTVFDPEGVEKGAWNWYGSQIRVPTLWDAAKARGLTTASVLWPVSVNHPAIDYNMPEYWRTKNRASDSHLLYAVSTPRGFLETVDGADRLFDTASNPDVWSFDERLVNIALAMIEEGRPQLLTIHLTGLDAAQHRNGPLPTNDVSRQTLEKTDTMIARLVRAQRAAYPDSTIAIVSDHGFHPVHATVNLNAAFARAGLIDLDEDGRLESWKAYSWNSGGSASVVLKDSSDVATHDAVEAILSALEGDDASGIASVLRGEAAVAEGALAEASFLVDAKGGFAMGGALTGETILSQAKTTGTHGYRNTHPEMNAAFFVVGPGVKAGKDLGQIDIRQIAPTLARRLDVTLPTAVHEPLMLGE